MLDRDLAKLYQCSNGTKSINLAVKRHINRFPERYMFKLTKDEYNNLRFQIETTNKNVMMIRNLPYAFTEQGVAMLSAILKTKVAEQISIQIMDAFVAMRKYISTNLIEQRYINNQVMKNTEDIKFFQESFIKFEEKRKGNEIYFNGQIWDSYSKIIDIFKEAKNELIIIDAYADKVVLDLIKNLDVIYNDTFHDRYFILDKKIIYHCGTSLNHLGNKTFSINVLEDEVVKESLINKFE